MQVGEGLIQLLRFTSIEFFCLLDLYDSSGYEVQESSVDLSTSVVRWE
jgi:hypothetical protein